MAFFRRTYGLYKHGSHLLFTTDLLREKSPEALITIPQIIPNLIDPFLLWYSIRSRKDIHSFTIDSDWLYVHLHDTDTLKYVESLIHEPNEEIKKEKIDALAKDIAKGLEELKNLK